MDRIWNTGSLLIGTTKTQQVKINIACIGAGYFSRFHIEAWKRISEVELVAICDADLDKAKQMAGEFNVAHTYATVEQLMEEETFEVADIITPPPTHLPLCGLLAGRGKHIICQKPLAPSLEEAKQIVELCEKAGIRFMVHENFRFQPWYRKMKEMMEEGLIGDKLHQLYVRMRMGDGWGEDAYLGRQPYFRTMPRLLIYETGIHFIDVFRYLAGEVTSVYARLTQLNPVIAGEDSGMVLFEFERGGLGIFDANRYNESNAEDARYTFGQCWVEGNGGTIRLYPDGKLTLQPLGQSEEEVPYVHAEERLCGRLCICLTASFCGAI